MESAYVLQLVPSADEEEVDVKFAVELGLCILLNKPIIAVVMDDRPVPPKLLLIADKVIYADIDTEAGRAKLALEIYEYVDREHEREDGGIDG